jgi:hypothetical protein
MIYLLVFFAIFIPYIAPEDKKIEALLITMLLLFIPWGLQYEMTQDWEPHLLHWNVINNGAAIMEETKEMEPVYVFLLEMLSPFTYFGYLMICAIIDLGIITYGIRKYVNSEYYWISIAVLMLCVENGLLMINSNRMTVALMLTIVGVINLFRDDENEDWNDEEDNGIRWNRILAFVVLWLIAINIHSSAIAAVGIIPIYIVSKKISDLSSIGWIVIMNLFFALRFFIDISTLQVYAMIFLEGTGVEGFDNYIDEIENADKLSRVYTPIFFILLNVILLMYHKMTSVMKFFALAFIIKIQFSSYLIGNIGRILQYYYIYSIFLIPYLVSLTKSWENEFVQRVRTPVCMLFFVLVIYDFIKYITTNFCYEKWQDFTTVFEAPYWI